MRLTRADFWLFHCKKKLVFLINSGVKLMFIFYCCEEKIQRSRMEKISQMYEILTVNVVFVREIQFIPKSKSLTTFERLSKCTENFCTNFHIHFWDSASVCPDLATREILHALKWKDCVQCFLLAVTKNSQQLESQGITKLSTTAA